MSNNLERLQAEIAKDVRDNTTIELASDITLDEGLYFVGEDDNPVENLTINGNGHTITASDTFHTNSYGQNNLVKFDKVENAVLENVTLETNELAKHVLDVYDTTLTIENVTSLMKKITRNDSFEIPLDGRVTITENLYLMSSTPFSIEIYYNDTEFVIYITTDYMGCPDFSIIYPGT